MITRINSGAAVRIDNSTNLKNLSTDMRSNGMWDKVKYSLEKTTVYANIEIPTGVALTIQPYELLQITNGVAPATSSGILNKSSTMSWVKGSANTTTAPDEE